MNDIVIVNESPGIAIAGDVLIFRNSKQACLYLEYWWVEDGEGFALSLSGDRLVLGVKDDQVVELGREPYENGRDIVLSWLQSVAKTPSTDINQMIQSVGFTA
ncbi:hypothetical protein [Asticcacaulis endophyticus]|uniref:hypothetical protein n=1 Tax=Asticcacaulis endophyticus TaxID=1395890 RepID=UPI00167932A8|nr:hypothetical protein [Asticcacaulis endophyticus]